MQKEFRLNSSEHHLSRLKIPIVNVISATHTQAVSILVSSCPHWQLLSLSLMPTPSIRSHTISPCPPPCLHSHHLPVQNVSPQFPSLHTGSGLKAWLKHFLFHDFPDLIHGLYLHCVTPQPTSGCLGLPLTQVSHSVFPGLSFLLHKIGMIILLLHRAILRTNCDSTIYSQVPSEPQWASTNARENSH